MPACVCVCVCVRACVCACACACMHACVRACYKALIIIIIYNDLVHNIIVIQLLCILLVMEEDMEGATLLPLNLPLLHKQSVMDSTCYI